MSIYLVEDIDDYMGKITEEQSIELLDHCNKWNIAPEICAWYDDIDDLYDDYNEHCDYDRWMVDDMMDCNYDMFCEFSNGEIIKLIK